MQALASSLNDAVPSYQLAAQQAAGHVLATWTGFLQAESAQQQQLREDTGKFARMVALSKAGTQDLSEALQELLIARERAQMRLTEVVEA